MKTKLRAEVEVTAVTVLAEVAVFERRPELALVCRAAAQRGGLDVQLFDSVLPGLSEAARSNLRRHCEYLGLCDGEGRLTEAGRHCAERSEAPIPEQGVYTFWVAQHPLCGVRLLHFRREHPDPRDSDFQNLQAVPDWLQADRSRSSESVLDRTRFCLRELHGPPQQPVKCRLAGAPACQLSWDIDLSTGENQWSLTGQLEWSGPEGRQGARFTTPRESIRDLEGPALFASWERRWSKAQGYAAMDFDGKLGEAEGAFRRDFRYPSVTVPSRGQYANVEVIGVPVGPSSQAQAQRWADALLLAALEKEQGYVVTSRLQALWSGLIRGTPLQGFSVKLAGVEEYLRALEGKERVYWMLAAPFDLQPGHGPAGNEARG